MQAMCQDPSGFVGDGNMLRLVKQLSPIALGTRLRARRRHNYARLHGRALETIGGTGVSGRLFSASYQQLSPYRRPAMQARISVSTRERPRHARILARKQKETRHPALIHIGINLCLCACRRRLVPLVRQGQVLASISIAPLSSGLASVMLSLPRMLADPCAQWRERCRLT